MSVFKKNSHQNISSSKKRVFLFVIVGLLFLAMFVNLFMSIDMDAGMQELVSRNEMAPDESEMTNTAEAKEDFLINLETRMEKMQEDNMDKAMQMNEKLGESIKSSFTLELVNIHTALGKLSGKIDANKQDILNNQTTQAEKDQKMAEEIAKLMSKIEQVDKKKASTVMLPPPPMIAGGSNGGSDKKKSMFDNLSITSVTGGSAQPKATHAEKQDGGEMIEFSVKSYHNDFPEINTTKETKLTNEELAKQKTYEVAIGFTDAFMITGAYAPLFGDGGGTGGSAMKAVPVLMESEGDLIMPNDTIGSIDKCMLIGTALGNAASNTIDVRLEKMSCIVNGGKQIIDGKIKGWLVSEIGTPGLPATMVYRAGQYISRMIGSGILEGLSQGFINAAAAGQVNTTGGYVQPIQNGAISGAGNGVSNAFSKLADFYLQLAEATVPVLEAKGGRTVTLVMEGGDKFQLRDVNLLDTRELADYIDEFVGESDE